MQRIVRALFAAMIPAVAAAQDWPARPIRFVVPWTPGGLNDVVARVFNDRVSTALGQVIVNDSARARMAPGEIPVVRAYVPQAQVNLSCEAGPS